ncbi:MAG: FAD-dependent oxidoreductase [Holophagales bacterium]|nr:FAD-dependent oxidoreductase [Holophagales bacterium]
MTTRRLVLLGGGHAHVHVLSRAVREPLAGVEVVLISPFERHHYSGMVPGYLQGTDEEPDLAFDLRAIAARAGARFVQAAAERIDAGARTVEAAGERIAWDLLSVDVGSGPAGLEIPGVREHASSVRPMSRAVALRLRAEELFSAERGQEVPLVVVGGGAAGFEVALALERLGRSRGCRPEMTVVEAEARVLPGFSPKVRRIAERVLEARGVRVRTGRWVTLVEPHRVQLDDGTYAPSNLTVWLAGAAPPALFARSDVPKDPRGYLLVDDTLRAVDGTPVFGAGDCIGIEGHPDLAKAGVYAVRESPVLAHNLRAALDGGPPRRYRPQKSYLALMNSADGRALWRWHALSGHSRLAWRLKDRIDRGFMRRYQ